MPRFLQPLRPATVLALVFLLTPSCSTRKAPPPFNPDQFRLPSTSRSNASRAATPPHRLSRHEYPFDSAGNYVTTWAAEGERRAGRPAVVSPSRPSHTSSWRPSSRTVYHTVHRGDTLSALARRYGTSVSAIKSRNGLRSDLIRIGQRLRIR